MNNPDFPTRVPFIEHYTADRVPNPSPTGDLTWQAYHTVRSAVLRCCRTFGPSGPMGECPISDAQSIPDSWPIGDPDPLDYFVVDDQFNHDRYIYVEIVRQSAFNGQWMHDLMRTLADHDGWGVGIAFPKGYVIVFKDKLMVTGEIFETCTNVECVIRQGEATLARQRR
jgi:hypothetical protein